ncbi:glycosyltransferase family 2 protein [Hutsoniella sourekii]
MRAFAVLIPAYRPMFELTDYVQQLLDQEIPEVVIINDGNSKEYDRLFANLSRMEGVTVLKHDHNQGKGEGLKTGCRYLLNSSNHYLGLVTADADGQHAIRDVIAAGEKLESSQADIVLGMRRFDYEHVPFRSRLGNELTAKVFNCLYGVYIRDTQTGLRAWTKELCQPFSELVGSGFEYEINMLIYLAKNQLNWESIDISTIYHSEHFSNYQTVKDSSKIAWQLIKGLGLPIQGGDE